MLYSGRVGDLRYQYFLGDVVAFLTSSAVVAYLKFKGEYTLLNVKAYIIMLIVVAVVYLGLLYLSGNYESDVLMHVKPGIYIRAVLYSALFFYVASFYLRGVSYSRVYFTAFFAVNLFLAVVFRMGLAMIHKMAFGEKLKLPLVAVGFEKAEAGLLNQIESDLKLAVVARLPATSSVASFIECRTVTAATDSGNETDQVGVLIYESNTTYYESLIEYCESNYVPVYIVPSAVRMHTVPLRTITYKHVLIFSPRDLLVDGVSKRLKRIVDVTLALIGLVLTSWLMAIIWLLIRISSSGPGIYSQERLGLDGKIIKIYKFRTMYEDSEKRLHHLLKDEKIRQDYYDNFKLAKDPRITKLGSFLRRCSLDELPQLINILLGDISFVGPRAIIPPEISRYGSHAKMVLRVKPGLTGLWQVSGRSNLSYDERIRLDLYYIRNWSLAFDLKIIVRTVPSVLTGLGAK